MAEAVETARAFRAMGTDCLVRVVVDQDRAEPILERAESRMHELEHRWSRFIDGSELSQLNAHSGAPVFVSAETFELVALAVEASRATDGRFDPSMLDALIASGYDRTFDEISDRGEVIPNVLPDSHAIDDVDLDARTRMILTPPGFRFDLGGIGKGRAVDVVFEQLVADGVVGICLDFGGDLRVGGSPVAGGGWPIVIDDPFHPGEDLLVLGIGEGSVTTSSRLRRSWSTTSGAAHHLLDPSTKRPTQSGVASVTVISALAAWGEVHAKAALIAGVDEGARLIEDANLSALFVEDDGTLTTVGEFEKFVVDGLSAVS
jgi:thiamine biosynthesis lipoprotein